MTPPPGFVVLDEGRLFVHESAGAVASVCGLETFAAWFALGGGEEVRRIGARATSRLPAGLSGLPWELYLKRFEPIGWGERLKNWLSLKRVHHGARPEFEAALRFQQLGIPTVEPIVFGEAGGRSLLVTRGLVGYRDLKELLAAGHPCLADAATRRRMATELADMARTMHGAGLHHQDFYLNHVLANVTESDGVAGLDDLRIIDLGRVRERRPLARRWIVKDLSQLDYSAALVSAREKVLFLRTYLGRPISREDRGWLRQVAAKSRWIDRHTRRHGL